MEGAPSNLPEGYQRPKEIVGFCKLLCLGAHHHELFDVIRGAVRVLLRSRVAAFVDRRALLELQLGHCRVAVQVVYGAGRSEVSVGRGTTKVVVR